jgi:hypothetical protein
LDALEVTVVANRCKDLKGRNCIWIWASIQRGIQWNKLWVLSLIFLVL